MAPCFIAGAGATHSCHPRLALLSTPARFTDHGTISLSVQREPEDWLTFAVSDTGIGLTEG
jgi:signal transduction histidine kinase